MFTRADELPEGLTRLPIKTIHINKSPVVIANLKTLTPAMAQRWGIDLEQALRHADIAARHAGKLAGMWPEVFQRPEPRTAADVDEDLYGGFVGNDDRRTLQRLRGLSPQALADKRAGLCRPAAGRTAVPLPRAQFPRDADTRPSLRNGRRIASTVCTTARQAPGWACAALPSALSALEPGADDRAPGIAGKRCATMR